MTRMMGCFLLATGILAAVLFETDAYNQKPIYHLTPEDGHWINDPNGPFFDAKFQKYHIFAQYNPNAPYWGDMSWIHWVSDDLVKWEKLPIAMTNDQSYDRDGVFSGSAILADDQAQIPYLVYTCVEGGTGIQRQCYSFAKDPTDPNYNEWTKSVNNPVIDLTSLPPGSNGANFRDPTMWPHSQGNNTWSLAAAAQLGDVGHVVRYDCTVLTNPKQTFSCQYYSSLWDAGASSTSAFKTYMVECPDFYPVEEDPSLYVLKYSIMEENRELYELGQYDEAKGVFLRDLSRFNQRLEYDYGPNFHYYASKRFYDSKQHRQVLWGWSNERDDQSVARNWAGVLALPREVHFDAKFGILRFPVIKEIEQLRIKTSNLLTLDRASVSSEETGAIVQILPLRLSSPSLAIEVKVSFEISYVTNATTTATCDRIEVGLLGRQSSDGSAYVKHIIGLRKSLSSDASSSLVYAVIDTTKAGGSSPSQVYQRDVPSYDAGHAALFLREDVETQRTHVKVDLQLFYDHSIVEMYAMDAAHASTVRVYPEEENIGLSLFTSSCQDQGDVVETSQLEVWTMDTLWK